MRITSSTAAAVVATMITLAGCSSDDSATPPSTKSEAATGATSEVSPESRSSDAATPTDAASGNPAPDSALLSVTIDGDSVLPNAEGIDLGVDEELRIEVTSDRAGELHVHAKPEQFIDFKAGTTKTSLVIGTPGSVEIEDHDTSAVVALLEVR